jgi:lysophospholipase L1-like esterase/azurin
MHDRFACLRKLLFFIGLCLTVGAALGQTSPLLPPPGSRIVLLGNTFAERMRHYGYFETLLQRRFAGQRLTVRNLGWSADEVGLQPRPLNFPGWGEKTTRLTTGKREVAFEGFTHGSEGAAMPLPLNLTGLNQDLTDQRADVIFLCFGLNEAFNGPAGLPRFEKDLGAFIANLRAHRYNGRSAPLLVLVSPIAHEHLGRPGRGIADPTGHNANLALYTRAMRKTAETNGLYFVDLFTPSLARMQTNQPPITINGIHLNEAGYRLAADWMGQALGWGGLTDPEGEHTRQLTHVIRLKDTHFFYRWRAVNGEYIYGRRREPFGVIAFPPELRKLNQMVAALDSVIWKLGQKPDAGAYAEALAIVDRRGQPLDPALIPTVPMVGRQGKAAREAARLHPGPDRPAGTESFKLPAGYAINLFASEKDFPVQKPVALNFDARGRLWVATLPTYPQVFPGVPVHDKLLILEDTDGDGRADKHTVFADNLYLPLGFEFGDGGVYVSQEPDLVFLKDTTGDDRADVREVVLSGFGSEDSHHAIHAFAAGPDGALYFNEGTFLNSQVETPYGPVRSYAGTTYRYEPRTARLSAYVSYPYYNPWGNVFDRWGNHLLADASDGSNYFAPPLTGQVTYPTKHPRTNGFTETRVRPTAGIELVSSRHFPDSAQGNFLVNNTIGFQGTKQYRIGPAGSGIVGREVAPLLQSTDPSFRPIDLKFGPDGALYLTDWYNPLISHGENPPRDPARDTAHGRIWRITYPARPLLPVVDLSKASLPTLLDSLKAPEDRFRNRVRAELQARGAGVVLPALKTWLTGLDPTHPEYEHHRLEGLWLYQAFDTPDEALLDTLLAARHEQARAAAARVLLRWKDRLPYALTRLRTLTSDASPRVRLEAVVALSFFGENEAVAAALDVRKYPTDPFLDYALGETLLALKPAWLARLRQEPDAYPTPTTEYLLGLATTAEVRSLPRTPAVMAALLTRPDVDAATQRELLDRLTESRNTSRARVLLSLLDGQAAQPARSGPGEPPRHLMQGLLAGTPTELKSLISPSIDRIRRDTSQRRRATAYAVVMAAEQSDRSVWPLAQAMPTGRADYLRGVALLPDGALKTSFRQKVRGLAAAEPVLAYPLLVKMSATTGEKTRVLEAFIASLVAMPEADLNAPAFLGTVNLARKLVAELPAPNRPPLLARLEGIGTLELTLTAVEAKMAFDKTKLVVPAGKAVSLLFKNPDLMPHNVVIVRPGSGQRVGEAADAMARLPDGFERQFVPDSPDVLFATPLVSAGKTYRLVFKAPTEPGDYPFLCSFPGHWRVMQGVLRVRETKKP